MDKHLLNIDISHPLQLAVLEKLRHHRTLEYAQLLPDGFSGNEFLYHLKKLTSAKLIYKIGQVYSLSALGLLISDSASYDTNKMKVRPTVGFWLLVKNDDNKVMLYESKRAPFFDLLCLPFGKLRVGESVEETLIRMLKKRGLDTKKITETEHYAVNVRYQLNGELIAHRYGEVLSCLYSGNDEPIKSTKNGNSYFTIDGTSYLESILSSDKKPDYIIEII